VSGQDVLVVVGVGGMGAAAARRLGAGRTVVLADVNRPTVDALAVTLESDGYLVEPHTVDVADSASVAALADAAAQLGPVRTLVHTAGLSPVQAPAEAVLRVDLLGTALILDSFGAVIAAGGAGVCIASMAGTTAVLDADLERRLATTPAAQLMALPEVAAITDPGAAYGLAKRGNQVRVRAAATVWGHRGARVNSISPGIIATPMGTAELAGPSGDLMRGMIQASATGRLGTPEDIAAAAEFLVGPHATFITGTDLLVDGGAVSGLTYPG
jgi:NAD(P)-dependent dehydrogenase (short-subunit alcohol dehydrogenase family)